MSSPSQTPTRQTLKDEYGSHELYISSDGRTATVEFSASRRWARQHPDRPRAYAIEIRALDLGSLWRVKLEGFGGCLLSLAKDCADGGEAAALVRRAADSLFRGTWLEGWNS